MPLLNQLKRALRLLLLDQHEWRYLSEQFADALPTANDPRPAQFPVLDTVGLEGRRVITLHGPATGRSEPGKKSEIGVRDGYPDISAGLSEVDRSLAVHDAGDVGGFGRRQVLDLGGQSSPMTRYVRPRVALEEPQLRIALSHDRGLSAAAALTEAQRDIGGERFGPSLASARVALTKGRHSVSMSFGRWIHLKPATASAKGNFWHGLRAFDELPRSVLRLIHQTLLLCAHYNPLHRSIGGI